jgi:predicted deacylase
MRPRKNLLEYNEMQVRHILNLCHCSRPGFCRKWGVSDQSLRSWIVTDKTARARAVAKKTTVPEHICRRVKAMLDMHCQEVEINIMRDLMLYKLNPDREKLAKRHGVSTALVAIAVKNLVEDGILAYSKNPVNNKCGKMDVPAFERSQDLIPEDEEDWKPRNNTANKGTMRHKRPDMKD